MKALLEFDLPEEQESLDDAVHGSEWRSALEAISWQVLCWAEGKPGGEQFPGRGPEEPMPEIRPILDLIHYELVKRGLE